MKNFIRISEGLDVAPLLAALAVRADLWNENTLRTAHPASSHGEVSDIWLWFNEVDEENPGAVVNEIFVTPYRAWFGLPQARPLVFDLMHRIGGVQLGRVMITKLPPGGKILPHTDVGAPAEFFERHHIYLQGTNSIFSAGDEKLKMQPGEAWWFNNQVEHDVVNMGFDDRIVMIVDVRVA